MCTNVLFLTIVECYPTHFYVVGSHYFLKTNALPQTRGLQATVLNVAILAPANVVVFLRDAEDVCFHITRSSDVSLYRTVEYETITYDTNWDGTISHHRVACHTILLQTIIYLVEWSFKDITRSYTVLHDGRGMYHDYVRLPVTPSRCVYFSLVFSLAGSHSYRIRSYRNISLSLILELHSHAATRSRNQVEMCCVLAHA